MKKYFFRTWGLFASNFEIKEENGQTVVRSITKYINWPWSRTFSIDIRGRLFKFVLHAWDQRKWDILDENGHNVGEFCGFVFKIKTPAKLEMNGKKYNINFVFNASGIHREIVCDDKNFSLTSKTVFNWFNKIEGEITYAGTSIDIDDYMAMFCGVFSLIKEDAFGG